MSDGALDLPLSILKRACNFVLIAFREAPFLTGERACRMARAASIGILVGIFALILTAHGGTDRNGTVPGGDFVLYWVAAGLAAAGHASNTYVPELVSIAEHQAVAMQADGFLPFYYPPVWLLILVPFSALPYLAAWLAFCSTTGVAFLLMLRRLLPRYAAVHGIWFAILGFPGLLVNAGNGQNGFVTAGCFAAYGVLLDRKPFFAGASLGMLCFKPQFAIGVPFALLAARRISPLLGAAFGSASLVVGSVALFGLAPWQAFLDALPTARKMFETQLLYPFKLMSVLGGLRLLGVPTGLAYMTQLVVSVAALAAATLLIARRPGALMEAAVLAASSLLVTPYSMDYDLPVAAVAMVAVFAAAQRRGFLPWEKTVLVAAYVLPLVGPAIAREFAVPSGPVILGGLLVITLRASRAV